MMLTMTVPLNGNINVFLCGKSINVFLIGHTDMTQTMYYCCVSDELLFDMYAII